MKRTLHVLALFVVACNSAHDPGNLSAIPDARASEISALPAHYAFVYVAAAANEQYHVHKTREGCETAARVPCREVPFVCYASGGPDTVPYPPPVWLRFSTFTAHCAYAPGSVGPFPLYR